MTTFWTIALGACAAWAAAAFVASWYATPPLALRRRYWRLMWPRPRWAKIERVATAEDFGALQQYWHRGRYWRGLLLVPVVFHLAYLLYIGFTLLRITFFW